MKKLIDVEKLSSVLFYFAILLFIIGYNFTDTLPSGWYQQFMPNIGNQSVADITFLDSLTGFAVTQSATINDTAFILKTTNSGDNWSIIYRTVDDFSRIKFVSQNIGYASGGGFYKTVNAGQNWAVSNSPAQFMLHDMAVLNVDTIWVVSSQSLTGGVFRTTNGGQNWVRQFDSGSSNPDHIYMFNGRIGFISKTNSYTRKTTDGGQSWFIVVNGEGFIDMNFTDSLTGERTVKPRTDKTKKENTALWYTKYVLIPKDVNTTVINLDLTNYFRLLGLSSNVSEDIRTTDITFSVTDADDTSSGADTKPLARIFINHSDKITRESGTFIVILDNIGDYKRNEADDLLSNTSEFTFIFPRSPDDIDVQNKMIQQKKDVILNVTEGKNDNYDADFRIGMELKEIRQKVRSLSADYPSVKTILLTRTDVLSGIDRTMPEIIDELEHYSFRVYTDTSLTKLLSVSDNDSKNKIGIIVSQMKFHASAGKKLMTILNLTYDEFQSFYSEVLTMKKLGYRFYTLSRMNEIELEKQKREKLKQEKADKTKDTKKEQTPKQKKEQPKKKNAKK